MSAREAWLIVRNGGPVGDDVATYQRACAIVEAKIVEHELTVQLESDPENIKLSLARGQAYLKVRALERGKGEGK